MSCNNFTRPQRRTALETAQRFPRAMAVIHGDETDRRMVRDVVKVVTAGATLAHGTRGGLWRLAVCRAVALVCGANN